MSTADVRRRAIIAADLKDGMRVVSPHDPSRVARVHHVHHVYHNRDMGYVYFFIEGSPVRDRLHHAAEVTIEETMIKRVTKGRKPEATEEVYNLGHNEQMQIDLALTFVAEFLAYDRTAADMLENVDYGTITSMMSIFRSHGTVTVIRHNEED